MSGLISYTVLNAFLIFAQTEPDNTNNVWEGWGSVIFVMGLSVLIAAIIIVIVWQVMASGRASMTARETVARDEAYRQLASESAQTQRRFSEEQERIANDLADIKARVGNIERILQEVE